VIEPPIGEPGSSSDTEGAVLSTRTLVTALEVTVFPATSVATTCRS